MNNDGMNSGWIARDDIDKNLRVSTVYIYMGPKNQILYETAIIGNWSGKGRWRYTTRDAALAGHEAVVKLVKGASSL